MAATRNPVTPRKRTLSADPTSARSPAPPRSILIRPKDAAELDAMSAIQQMWHAADEWRELVAEGAAMSPNTVRLYREYVASIALPRGRPSRARHFNDEHVENALHLYEAARNEAALSAEAARRLIAAVYDIADNDGSADDTVLKMLQAGRRQRRK